MQKQKIMRTRNKAASKRCKTTTKIQTANTKREKRHNMRQKTPQRHSKQLKRDKNTRKTQNDENGKQNNNEKKRNNHGETKRNKMTQTTTKSCKTITQRHRVVIHFNSRHSLPALVVNHRLVVPLRSVTLTSRCANPSQVQAEIKRKWRRWHLQRYMSSDTKYQHPSIGSSNNFSTQITMLTRCSPKARRGSSSCHDDLSSMWLDRNTSYPHAIHKLFMWAPE